MGHAFPQKKKKKKKKKKLIIGLSETPRPAFPGSNAVYSYVYFV